jgi:catalase
VRGFHAKVHGCMKADFELDANRPPATRYGLFADDAPKQAWVRLSNGQGKAGADNERDVRGLAIKVMGVQGERLVADGATTQDFLMTTRAASHVNDAVEFMDFADYAANGKLIAWGLKHPVAASRLFIQTAPVRTLLTRFWSGSPYRLGPNIAKFSVWPCAGLLTTTQGTTSSDPDFLRGDLQTRLATGDVCYEFGVQIRKDPSNESVEKASSVWDEQRNPFVRVARLVIPQGTSTIDEEYCNDLAFNPWNGLAEHQPLGHMNRARKSVYKSSAAYRGHLPEPRPE